MCYLIVKKHHHAFRHWAHHRRSVESAPILVTLDHHTDTLMAYYRSFFNGINNVKQRHDEAIAYARSVNFRDDNSIDAAIKRLEYDQHIDAAIKADILSKAFVINYSEKLDKPTSIEIDDYYKLYPIYLQKMQPLPPKPLRPYHYPESSNSMYVIGCESSIGCGRTTHDEECEKIHYDVAIESELLAEKLAIINEIVPGMVIDTRITQSYILDIDLDYFHTRKSINPDNTMIFYQLIRNADLITVALEQGCVEYNSYEEEDVTSEWLLERLDMHIQNAISG